MDEEIYIPADESAEFHEEFCLQDEVILDDEDDDTYGPERRHIVNEHSSGISSGAGGPEEMPHYTIRQQSMRRQPASVRRPTSSSFQQQTPMAADTPSTTSTPSHDEHFLERVMASCAKLQGHRWCALFQGQYFTCAQQEDGHSTLPRPMRTDDDILYVPAVSCKDIVGSVRTGPHKFGGNQISSKMKKANLVLRKVEVKHISLAPLFPGCRALRDGDRFYIHPSVGPLDASMALHLAVNSGDEYELAMPQELLHHLVSCVRKINKKRGYASCEIAHMGGSWYAVRNLEILGHEIDTSSEDAKQKSVLKELQHSRAVGTTQTGNMFEPYECNTDMSSFIIVSGTYPGPSGQLHDEQNARALRVPCIQAQYMIRPEGVISQKGMKPVYVGIPKPLYGYGFELKGKQGSAPFITFSNRSNCTDSTSNQSTTVLSALGGCHLNPVLTPSVKVEKVTNRMLLQLIDCDDNNTDCMSLHMQMEIGADKRALCSACPVVRIAGFWYDLYTLKPYFGLMGLSPSITSEVRESNKYLLKLTSAKPPTYAEHSEQSSVPTPVHPETYAAASPPTSAVAAKPSSSPPSGLTEPSRLMSPMEPMSSSPAEPFRLFAYQDPSLSTPADSSRPSSQGATSRMSSSAKPKVPTEIQTNRDSLKEEEAEQAEADMTGASIVSDISATTGLPANLANQSILSSSVAYGQDGSIEEVLEYENGTSVVIRHPASGSPGETAAAAAAAAVTVTTPEVATAAEDAVVDAVCERETLAGAVPSPMQDDVVYAVPDAKKDLVKARVMRAADFVTYDEENKILTIAADGIDGVNGVNGRAGVDGKLHGLGYSGTNGGDASAPTAGTDAKDVVINLATASADGWPFAIVRITMIDFEQGSDTYEEQFSLNEMPTIRWSAKGGKGGNGAIGGDGGDGAMGRNGNDSNNLSEAEGGPGGNGGDGGAGTGGAYGGNGGKVRVKVSEADSFLLMALEPRDNDAALSNVRAGEGGLAGRDGKPGAGGAGGKGGELLEESGKRRKKRRGKQNSPTGRGADGPAGRPGRVASMPVGCGIWGSDGNFSIEIDGELSPGAFNLKLETIEIQGDNRLRDSAFEIGSVVHVQDVKVVNEGHTPVFARQAVKFGLVPHGESRIKLLDEDRHIAILSTDVDIKTGGKGCSDGRIDFLCRFPELANQADFDPIRYKESFYLSANMLDAASLQDENPCSIPQFSRPFPAFHEGDAVEMDFKFPVENESGITGVQSLCHDEVMRFGFDFSNVGLRALGDSASPPRQLALRFYVAEGEGVSNAFEVSFYACISSDNEDENKKITLTRGSLDGNGTVVNVPLLPEDETATAFMALSLSTAVPLYSRTSLEAEIMLQTLPHQSDALKEAGVEADDIFVVQRRELTLVCEPPYCPQKESHVVLVTSSSTTLEQYESWTKSNLLNNLGLTVETFSLTRYASLDPEFPLSNGMTLREAFEGKLVILLNDSFKIDKDPTLLEPVRFLPHGGVGPSDGFEESTRWLIVDRGTPVQDVVNMRRRNSVVTATGAAVATPECIESSTMLLAVAEALPEDVRIERFCAAVRNGLPEEAVRAYIFAAVKDLVREVNAIVDAKQMVSDEMEDCFGILGGFTDNLDVLHLVKDCESSVELRNRVSVAFSVLLGRFQAVAQSKDLRPRFDTGQSVKKNTHEVLVSSVTRLRRQWRSVIDSNIVDRRVSRIKEEVRAFLGAGSSKQAERSGTHWLQGLAHVHSSQNTKLFTGKHQIQSRRLVDMQKSANAATADDQEQRLLYNSLEDSVRSRRRLFQLENGPDDNIAPAATGVHEEEIDFGEETVVPEMGVGDLSPAAMPKEMASPDLVVEAEVAGIEREDKLDSTRPTQPATAAAAVMTHDSFSDSDDEQQV